MSLGSMFQTVDSEGEALELIKSITNWFYILAGLTALFSLMFLNPLGLIDAVIYAAVAYWLARSHSKLAGFILMVIAGVLFARAVAGGVFLLRSIIVRGAMLLLSFRAVQATFKLANLRAATAATTGMTGGGSNAPARRPSGGGTAGGRPSSVDISADLEALRGLKKAGSDLSKPHLPEFLLQFPSEPPAQEAAEKVKALGFETEVRPPMQGRQWVVRAEKSMVLNEEALKRTRYQFDKIARAGGGSYDGWGAPPVD